MSFNDAITSSKFPSSLKMANMKVAFKKGTKVLKKTTDLWFTDLQIHRSYFSEDI